MAEIVVGPGGVGRSAALQINSSSNPGTTKALMGLHGAAGGEKSSTGRMNPVATDPMPAPTVVTAVIPRMGYHPWIPTGTVVMDATRRWETVVKIIFMVVS